MTTKRKTIYLVDDSMTTLIIGKNALVSKFDVFTIPSGTKLLEMVRKKRPNLILLDIEMPDMDGYEVIRRLKANPDAENIPVIFLTGKSDTKDELEGFSLGAIDYITKPFSPPLLLKRVEIHLLVEDQKSELKMYNDNLLEMVEAKTNTVLTLQNTILRTVAELVEYRDDITGKHIERTQNYIRVLIDALVEGELYREEMESWNIKFLLQSAQLHDVGKITIKDSILQKPAKLTVEEFNEMKNHTTSGVKILENIQKTTNETTFLEHAKIFAGTHHEKWDGSGYPAGLLGRDIPLQGRLMAVADVYDALISERPYKKPFSHQDAVRIILDGRGTHFDPVLVDVFARREHDFREIACSF